MNYKDVLHAKELLELPDQVTMEQIRVNYRSLLKRYHPDSCRDDPDHCAEMTRLIVTAYRIISRYCNEYHFLFTEEEIRKYCSAEDWWFVRFGNDPNWQK